MSSSDPRRVQPFTEPYAMDEPIRTTVKRDLLRVADKFVYVCSPAQWEDDDAKLRQWDLWGPLLLGVILSLGSWMKAAENDRRTVFAFLFGFYWLGLYAITLNLSLLGTNVYALQGIAVLGYASFPLVGSAMLALFVPSVIGILKLIIVAAGAYLTVRASLRYIRGSVQSERFFLAAYPLVMYAAVVGVIVSLI